VKHQVWKRNEVDSPCVNICVVHPRAGLCVGCLRSLEEIAAWSDLSHEDRAAITATLSDRKSLISKRRGGRAARV